MRHLPRLSKKAYIQYAIILITLVAVITSAVFFAKYRSLQASLNDLPAANQTEANDLVQRISHVMLLPKDEEPILATVNDQDKLKSQPFFKDAQNGDKVLLYSKGKLAILYRPQDSLIVAVAPFNASAETDAAASNPEQ